MMLPRTWRRRVYPACAGIDLAFEECKRNKIGLPRMRGDRPCADWGHQEARGFTPHARGSTPQADPGPVSGRVYPACAGIDPIDEVITQDHPRLPRMRGDRPTDFTPFHVRRGFTPHARGSTHRSRFFGSQDTVYPACAGIDLAGTTRARKRWCLPRMRGDRPHHHAVPSHRRAFTPHARGSTESSEKLTLRLRVYPACAGIDLKVITYWQAIRCLPRMRGDRPTNVTPFPLHL